LAGKKLAEDKTAVEEQLGSAEPGTDIVEKPVAGPCQMKIDSHIEMDNNRLLHSFLVKFYIIKILRKFCFYFFYKKIIRKMEIFRFFNLKVEKIDIYL
jgi:hypothetical protein